jgi:periplasmic divalent cation tolerance protein
MATDIVVIFCTAAPDAAAAMAEQLVDRRLVACVSILPARSTYRWKGKVCREPEHLMIAKTTKARAEAAVTALRSLHPYEVPEIIVLPVIEGHAPYLDWVRHETGGTP